MKRPVRALAATTAAGSVLLLAAPPAAAEVVDVAYTCQTPIGEKSAVSPVDIKAAKSGGSYKLTMSFQKGVSSSPVELGKGAMTPSALIKLGGAESGTVKVTGPANAAAIPANTPIKIGDLSGTYTPAKSGKVTFTASTLTITALGTTTTCNHTNDPKPSLTLDVEAASGSGSSGGSQSSPADGEGLPRTGPLDSTVALGTLGGTVLLSGVAGVLWLSLPHRLRRGRDTQDQRA
jgi:hypothetical protein